MSIGATTTAPIDRLRALRSRSPGRHGAAILTAAVAVILLEWYVTDLDHGTHLLVLLTLILAMALVLGPRPATSGFATGGSVAGVASIMTIDGAFALSHAYVQLLAYVVAGIAFIVLVSVVRSRPRPTSLPAPTAAAVPGNGGPVEALTPREREVLHLAASGISVDEMARRLFVSPNTVKTHLTHIYGKLGVRGRSDAVRAAVHCGCLTVDDICPHLHGAREESPVRVMPEHRKG